MNRHSVLFFLLRTEFIALTNTRKTHDFGEPNRISGIFNLCFSYLALTKKMGKLIIKWIKGNLYERM